jgi:hypothetical protein
MIISALRNSAWYPRRPLRLKVKARSVYTHELWAGEQWGAGVRCVLPCLPAGRRRDRGGMHAEKSQSERVEMC